MTVEESFEAKPPQAVAAAQEAVASDWPVTPLTWFGDPARDPATATADRCALAVARPMTAPTLTRQQSAVLDFAVRVATKPRLRIWDNPWLCKFDSARDALSDWLASGQGYVRVHPSGGDLVAGEYFGVRWSGRVA